jgi:hypothetical protein
MRGQGKKGDGRWHDVLDRPVRFTEHKIQRQARDSQSGLILLGQRVDHATAEKAQADSPADAVPICGRGRSRSRQDSASPLER